MNMSMSCSVRVSPAGGALNVLKRTHTHLIIGVVCLPYIDSFISEF